MPERALGNSRFLRCNILNAEELARMLRELNPPKRLFILPHEPIRMGCGSTTMLQIRKGHESH